MPSSKRKIRFNVRRHGTPIRKYWLPRGVNPGISYGRSFTEVQACIAAGMDYYKWRVDEYPVWMKAEIVAWYELSGLIKAHAEAAAEKAAKRKGGKKGK